MLTPRERRQFVAVLCVTVVMGVVQVAGIGSIIPLLGILLDPSIVERNQLLLSVYQFSGSGDVKSFTLLLGTSVLLVLVLGNVLAAFSTWASIRYASKVHQRVSVSLLRRTLRQDYAALIGRNTAGIQSNVLLESMHFAVGIVMPVLNLVALGLKILLIGGFLMWLDPFVTVIAGLVLTVGYVLIYVFVRRPMERNGHRRVEANRAQLKSIAEAFGSVKEVKLLALEEDFCQRFVPHARTYADTVTLQRVLSTLPRYAIEALSFGCVIALLLFLSSRGANMESVLPLIATFVLAGYRLLPAFQGIYGNASALRFQLPGLEVLERDLGRGLPQTPTKAAKRFTFTRAIRLENVSYAYPESERPALRSVSLEIPCEAYVSFVGRTGAGKTTLADIILGLLDPCSGRMSVDGTDVTRGNIREWQAIIGYVPQQIYLTDESIAANIAFGIPLAAIDQGAVERAARMANIHDFIMCLPRGYETIVGERGVRLSGGQRQRIGLARALYRDPQVLILDEATSALDKGTEQEVHDAIFKAEAKTVIVIAHRMSTIRECDRIFVLDGGELVAEGRYEDLLRSSPEFRQIAREVAQDVPEEMPEKVALPS